jgi:hypothetical protein
MIVQQKFGDFLLEQVRESGTQNEIVVHEAFRIYIIG